MTNGAAELAKTVTVDLAFMSAQHMPNAWVFKPLDKTAHWHTILLPKSQITYELTEPMNTIWTRAKVTLPEWLAKKTGLQ